MTDAGAAEGLGEAPIGLIGGIGLTEVRVYAQHAAPDGLYSGCPHVHAVTAEAYFVLEGSGAVEFHELDHGYRKLPLERGQYVHFPPLVMHRLISDGTLVILGMMANAGLAERGEARIYFGKEIDQDPQRFAETVSLARECGLEGALRRRDIAVQGYQQLMELWAQDRPAYFLEIRRFFENHCRAMAEVRELLRGHVHQGPLAWANATLQRLDHLPELNREATDVQINRRGADQALGMCGVLRPVVSLSRQ